MLKCKIASASLLLLVLGVAATPAQDSKLAWLGEYIAFSELPILRPNYSNYSDEDLLNFEKKLKAVRSDRSENEWEGRFVAGGDDAVGISFMDISRNSGFANLYIYTCVPELRTINYGSMIDLPDMVELVPAVPVGSPRKATRARLVKVKWGNHLYLVEEGSLAVWAEKAVGRYVPSQDGYEQSWAAYWEKGDVEAAYAAHPTLPPRFRHLERKPIGAKLITVHSRKVETDFESGATFHGGESAVYRVRIDAGTKSGVRKGMVFSLKKTTDEMTVVKVAARSSEAVIVRALNDETRADHCLSDSLEPVPIQCPTIRAGMDVTTIVGKFFF